MVLLEDERREILLSFDKELTTEKKETLQYKLVQCYIIIFIVIVIFNSKKWKNN